MLYYDTFNTCIQFDGQEMKHTDKWATGHTCQMISKKLDKISNRPFSKRIHKKYAY